MRRWGERLKAQWREIFHPHVCPRDIALGLALGTLIGLTPLFGFHTLLAVFLSTVLRASRAGAIFMSWLVSNPFTFVPVYLFAYRIGNAVLHSGPDLPTFERHLAALETLAREQGHFHAFRQLFADLNHGLLALCGGGLILGVGAAIAVYFCALPVARRVQAAAGPAPAAAEPGANG